MKLHDENEINLENDRYNHVLLFCIPGCSKVMATEVFDNSTICLASASSNAHPHNKTQFSVH